MFFFVYTCCIFCKCIIAVFDAFTKTPQWRAHNKSCGRVSLKVLVEMEVKDRNVFSTLSKICDSAFLRKQLKGF